MCSAIENFVLTHSGFRWWSNAKSCKSLIHLCLICIFYAGITRRHDPASVMTSGICNHVPLQLAHCKGVLLCAHHRNT